MSIITFVNDMNEESGKTMSVVAIATYMAINSTNKILIVSTTDGEDKLTSCYFGEEQERKLRIGLVGENKKTLDTESGTEGIAKILRSGKLTANMITNFTRVVFKDRLEILSGTKGETEISKEYYDLVAVANMHYDMVFVDLDKNVDEETRERIINISNVVVYSSSQNYSSINKLKTEEKYIQLLNQPKTLVLLGRCDPKCKYNMKNVSRFLGLKNRILAIPYYTMYFEAVNEAGVPDFFLKLRKITNLDSESANFLGEIKRSIETINTTIQQTKIMG